MRKQIITLSLCLLGFWTMAQDEKSTQRMRVVKNDGTEYVGIVLKDDGKEILLESESLGKIYIPKRELRSLKPLTTREEKATNEPGTYSQDHPFSTRHAFTTNAFPIKKGENYGMINLHGPEIHFALTDQFNVGVMTTWAASPLALALKYSFLARHEKVHFSIGSLMMSSGFIQGFRGFGNLSFANVTFGSRNSNITLSGGYLYYRSGRRFIADGTKGADNFFDWRGGGNNNLGFIGQLVGPDDLPMQKAYPLQGPVVSLGGVFRVGAKASFIFDSMIGALQGKREKVNTTTIYDDFGNYMYYHEVSYVPYNSTFIFISPGMRFQSTDSFAWQFSIAQTSVVRSDRSRPISVPLPMLTLFKKF